MYAEFERAAASAAVSGIPVILETERDPGVFSGASLYHGIAKTTCVLAVEFSPWLWKAQATPRRCSRPATTHPVFWENQTWTPGGNRRLPGPSRRDRRCRPRRSCPCRTARDYRHHPHIPTPCGPAGSPCDSLPRFGRATDSPWGLHPLNGSLSDFHFCGGSRVEVVSHSVRSRVPLEIAVVSDVLVLVVEFVAVIVQVFVAVFVLTMPGGRHSPCTR